MVVLHHRFGQTTFAKVKSSEELAKILDETWFQSETVIIKPNWVTTEPGGYTEADTLRMMFEALDSKIVVTESLHIGRSMNLLEEGKGFTVGDKEVNWKWLMRGEGWNWLIENPGWDWFKEGGHWDHIKKEDKAFLDEYGFTDLFQDFNVTYVNVTDEVWNGRKANPVEVKKAVESRYKLVQIDLLYSMVPKKLYHLKGSTLISLARLKHYATLFKAVTGLDRSTAELLRVGWQIHEVEKAFNTLHARFSRKDDLPPMRVFTEPVKTGLWRRFKLSWERYNEMLTEYYSLHGWDPETGWQRREPLQKLGLKEVADKLDRYGCLSS